MRKIYSSISITCLKISNDGIKRILANQPTVPTPHSDSAPFFPGGTSCSPLSPLFSKEQESEREEAGSSVSSLPLFLFFHFLCWKLVLEECQAK